MQGWAQWRQSDLQLCCLKRQRPAGSNVSRSARCQCWNSQQDRIKKKKNRRTSSLLHVSTLGNNVSVWDLHWSQLAAGGAWHVNSPCRVTAVNKWPRAERLVGLGLDVPALSPGRVAQFSVEVGVNKSWIRVVLHQAVDFPLSRQKDVHVWLVEALHDGVFGVEVQVYLWPDRSSERQHQTLIH